jgi:hypothetical protein
MVRNVLTKVIPANAKNVLRRMRDGWKIGGFVPSIKPLKVGQREGRFFLGTPQANEWYEPMKPYAERIRMGPENVPLRNQSIVDGGAHRAYSVVSRLPGTGEIVVDPYPMNCDSSRSNLRPVAILAVNARHSARPDQCSSRSVQRANPPPWRNAGECPTLEEIQPEATGVKLDIEGSGV